jgi:short-subunit dehydrogenase
MHAYDFLQRYGPAALVTGASSGIGEAFAVLLARGGFDLVLNGRRKDRLDKLAARLRDHEGVNVTLCCEDLSTADGPQRLAAACIDRAMPVSASKVPTRIMIRQGCRTC